jgi:hypothetical protein
MVQIYPWGLILLKAVTLDHLSIFITPTSLTSTKPKEMCAICICSQCLVRVPMRLLKYKKRLLLSSTDHRQFASNAFEGLILKHKVVIIYLHAIFRVPVLAKYMNFETKVGYCTAVNEYLNTGQCIFRYVFFWYILYF